MACILPNNDYAYHSNEKATIILSTEKYTIDDKFEFTTGTCLIYAETIEISSSITQHGKSIGLFCHTLTIPSQVTIDVSGDNGKAGVSHVDQDGKDGGNGGNAGNVWICVQSLPTENAFQNLKIKASGGNGGRGGNSTSSQGKKGKGGNGGNGGNGGDIEVLFGTAENDAGYALTDIQTRPWPEQALCLAEKVLSDSLTAYLSKENIQLLGLFKSLSDVLRSLARQLEILSTGGDSKEIRTTASSLMQEVFTNLAAKDKAPKKVTTERVNSFQVVLESVRSLNRDMGDLDAKSTLTDAKKAIGTVAPQKDSEIILLMKGLQNRLSRIVLDMEVFVYNITKLNSHGTGGFNGIGSENGSSGKAGQKRGQSRARNLAFQGTKEDVDVLQAYIFPEHCQMLLNRADDLFFSSNIESWKRAYALYNTLLSRLQVLDGFQGNSSSGFFVAMKQLETELNITNNPITQLRSVYDQANSRRNRLLLGQDMFGHVDSWVQSTPAYGTPHHPTEFACHK